MGVVRLTPAADELARCYIADGVLKANMLADAQHIAMATVANVTALAGRTSMRRIKSSRACWRWSHCADPISGDDLMPHAIHRVEPRWIMDR